MSVNRGWGLGGGTAMMTPLMAPYLAREAAVGGAPGKRHLDPRLVARAPCVLAPANVVRNVAHGRRRRCEGGGDCVCGTSLACLGKCGGDPADDSVRARML